MAFAQFARAAQDERAGQIAPETYRNILQQRGNPKA